MGNPICGIFGHRYLTEFGSPFQFTRNLDQAQQATVTCGILVCSRCGKYQIVPSVSINFNESDIKVSGNTKVTRGKKNG